MDWKRHITTFIVVFLLVGLLVAVLGSCRGGRAPAGGPPPDARLVDLTLENAPAAPGRLSDHSFTIRAEVADTKAKRQQGLSGRAGLEPGHGMLYVYETPEQPEFSESSTRFPLSVAFLRADGTILGTHDTEANDPTPFSPPEPVRYALEVRRGWFQDRGVGVGARLRIPPELESAPTVPAAGAAPAAPSATSGSPAGAPPAGGQNDEAAGTGGA